MLRRAWWVTVFFGLGCTPMSVPDGGMTPDANGLVEQDAGDADAGGNDAGELDAGELDAGGRDAGAPDASIDAIALSLSADDRRIRLEWDAGLGTTEGWIVLRSGLELARLPGASREFEDFTAPAGSLDGFDASATLGLPDGIELEWTIPTATPGARVTYRVRTLGDAGVVSNEVDGQRAPPMLLGFDVQRGDGGWSFSPVETLWLDTSAPSPSVAVTSLQAVVEPHDPTSSVVVRATGDFARDASTQDYTVRARASAGADLEAFVSGARGGNRIAFQWQRSTDDSPDAFVDLPFVHGRLWLDPEAVMGEGRYYRVIAQAGANEWVSPPARARLQRPLFVVGDGQSHYLLREDRWCLPLGYAPVPLTQFPPVTEFVVVNGRPCGLLLDGGVECAELNGSHVQLPLPPATHIVGGASLCATTVDAGIVCTPSDVDVSAVVKVMANGASRFCGEYTDGGVRCVGRGNASVTPIVFDPPPVAVWVHAIQDSVTASFADGSTRGLGAPWLPPPDDAGYVAGTQSEEGNCGQRADGWIRCSTSFGAGNWAETPPLSPVRWQSAVVGAQGLCGLTAEGRVRCANSGLVPPRPPVRSISVQHGDVIAVTGDGLLDVRGSQMAIRFSPTLEDRFSRIGETAGCALRTDGGATCLGVEATEPLTHIASGFGLKPDGGLYSWGRSWPVTGPFVDLVDVRETNCARHADGGWTCEDPRKDPVPGLFTQLGYGNAGCGLSPRGKLTCWRGQPPPHITQHRFRHVSSTHLSCATTVEGEVLCWGGASPRLPWDDFVEYHEDLAGCGIRRDGTMACRVQSSFTEFPWALTP